MLPQIERWTSWLVNDVVIDSSVLGAWILPDEPAHAHAVRFMDAVGDGTIDPVLAAHFQFEVRHGLVRAARRGRVEWDDLPRYFRALDALEATIVPLSVPYKPVLDLARQHQLTWGEANWVEVAARLDLPLVTADRRLVRSVHDDVAIVVDVGEAPA